MFSQSFEEYLTHLEAFIFALKSAGFTLQLRKCEFFAYQIKYLGHISRPGTIEVEESSTRCLLNVRQLRSSGEIRSFLGILNVYRRFLRNYSDIKELLCELLNVNTLSKELPEFEERQRSTYRALIRRSQNFMC